MSWSHSSLKEFENCARRYHECRVLKNYPKEENEQALYGNLFHKAAELYTFKGTPLPKEFEYGKPLFDALMRKPGVRFAEPKMALSVDLEPSPWNDNTAWVRGIADLLILDNQLAWVVDYKTGSAKYPDKDQLDLMSLLVFAHFPKVQQVNSALIFVVKDVFIKHKCFRSDVDRMWWDYRARVAKIDRAKAHGVWNPTRSGLCKRHCPVLTCEFNGRN